MLSTALAVILSISKGFLQLTNVLIDTSVRGDLRKGKSEMARRVVRVLGNKEKKSLFAGFRRVSRLLFHEL